MNSAVFMTVFRIAVLPEEMSDNPPVLSSWLLLKHKPYGKLSLIFIKLFIVLSLV